MKKGIHPEYNEVEVHCSCGNTFKTKSTNKEIRLEICAECHPFFTGSVKKVDRDGRAENSSKIRSIVNLHVSKRGWFPIPLF